MGLNKDGRVCGSATLVDDKTRRRRFEGESYEEAFQTDTVCAGVVGGVCCCRAIVVRGVLVSALHAGQGDGAAGRSNVHSRPKSV